MINGALAERTGTDLLGYKMATTRLALEWTSYLDCYEVTLLQWLMANTLGRGRPGGNYSLDQMTDGIPKADGSGMWCNGTNISRRQLIRTIKSLVGKGLLSQVRTGRGSDLAVNLYWRPPTCVDAEDANVIKFPLSKRLKNRRPAKNPSLATRLKSVENNTSNVANEPEMCPIGTGRSAQQAHLMCQTDTLPKDITTKDLTANVRGKPPLPADPHREEDSQQENLPPTDHPADPREAVAQVRSRRQTSSASPTVQPVAKFPDNPFGYERAWVAACLESFPAVKILSWTKRDAWKLKSISKKFPAGTFVEFLTWVVTNWSRVTYEHCKWIKDRPETPDLGFLLKWHSHIVPVWQYRDQLAWIRDQKGSARQIAQLMASGMTFEQASHEVARSEALGMDREERREQLAAASDALATADRMRRRTEERIRAESIRVHQREKAVEERERQLGVQPVQPPLPDRITSTPKGDWESGKPIVLDELPVIDWNVD